MSENDLYRAIDDANLDADRELYAELDRLRDLVERARNALRPFAHLADVWEQSIREVAIEESGIVALVVSDEDESCITLDMVRAVRDLLKDAEGE